MQVKPILERIFRSSLFNVIKREFGRIANSWVLLFVTLVGPIASFLLVAWMFSAAVVREMPITLVDMDHSQMSRKIARLVDATPSVRIRQEEPDLMDARAGMMKGESEAVLYIPSGTEKSVQRGVQTELALYINNTNVVKGGVIQSQMVTTLATISGGIKVQTMVKKGIPPAEAMAKALPIRQDVHLLFNPYGNYAYFLMMGLLPLLAVVFIFLGSAYTIGIEMKEGTGTDWLQAAENSTTVALIGKLIPYLILFFADLMVMNILLIRVMGTPLKGALGAILLSEILLILAYQAMALLFLTFTANLRLTLSLGSAYTMMALTFSGLTFPAMGMALIARVFSWIFPYTFWLKVFLSQSMRGEPLHEVILPLLLMVPFILLGIVAFPFFKKRLNDERWQLRD